MMTRPPAPKPSRFVTVTLPWVMAGAGLVLYVATLSHWITFRGFQSFAQVAGLQWQPVLSNPLYFLLTLPLKLLPAAWLPVALNLFSALCAPLVLALLARTVALLPHDRTHPQRMAETSVGSVLTIRAAWLPVLFAVLACALQFGFWERAIVSGPEMLDLLLFAYAVRCLLEYRREARESWLFKAVFAYALGMTENWLLVLLLPGFVASLVWFMGFGFFNLRFLSRAWLLALAGLSLYLVLPAVAAFHPDSPVPYWPALKHLLGEQIRTIMLCYKGAPFLLALGALISVLPVFIMGIKLQTNYGDTSRIGTGLATFCFHVLHGALLVLCGWVALEPDFKYKGATVLLGPEFLPAKYLSAIAIGYFTGYFLLLFGERARLPEFRHDLHFHINRIVKASVWGFAIVIVALLLYRNVPMIRQNNGHVLRDYASLLVQCLPAQPAVLLSDDPRRLWLAEAYLARQPGSPKHLAVDTRLLEWPDYHRTLNRRSGGTWPLPPTNQPARIEPLMLVDRMLRQVAQRDVYYLHPSFGYYFEFLQAIPSGLGYTLRPFATNDIVPPPLPAAVLEENLRFWRDTAATSLAQLQRLLPTPEEHSGTNGLAKLLKRFRVVRGPNPDALMVASFHSRSLNCWGVQLQRAARLEDAGKAFALALTLNPRNVAARINQEFNGNLVAGTNAAVRLTRSLEEEFGAYRNWNQMIGENGPFDEPAFCYEQGRVFAQGGLYRQSLQEFERVRTLAPGDIPSRLWLANLYLTSRLFPQALAVVEEVKSRPDRFHLTSTNRTDFLSLEAGARFGQGETNVADTLLQSAITREPTNYYLLAVSAQVYLRHGQLTHAVKLFDQQLQLKPGDTDAMMNKGYACLQAGEYRQAIPTLDRLLQLQPSNHLALINRAIANLQAGELDAAYRDYTTLSKVFPAAYQVQYGLGEIAWRKQDTNAAIAAYTRYLTNAPANSTEAQAVVERLRQLKPGAP